MLLKIASRFSFKNSRFSMSGFTSNINFHMNKKYVLQIKLSIRIKDICKNMKNLLITISKCAVIFDTNDAQ